MPKISMNDVKKVSKDLKSPFPLKALKKGMETELEHKNVTGGDLKKTEKIALTHLKERPDYYTLLEKVEKAPRSKNGNKKTVIIKKTVKKKK